MEYYPAPGRNHLFVPGPTNIPEQVQRAFSRGNEDHRSPAFAKLSKSVIDDSKLLFGSKEGTVFLFPATGTGAWESALTNTLSPGDKILSFRMGQFSLLWVDQMQRLKFDVDVVDCDWGAGVELSVLKQKLAADRSHSIRAVCVVHNETATGVTNDIAGIRGVLDELSHPALLLIDGVSSIGAIEFKMDEWKVDVALTGSQKALSLPTGLGIVCARPKAIEASKTSKSTRVFFDWGDYLKHYKTGSYWPYTPSSQMLYALRASLDLLFEEGLQNVFKRHTRLAEGTRRAVEAWGLKLCTQKPQWKSDTVTTILVPSHINSNDVVKIAWKKYNLSLGLGLNKINGKAFRIGHLGQLNEVSLLGAIAGAELALREAGVPVKLGSGVAAAAAYFEGNTPLIASRL
eukprot:TRINITY_DN90_c0_g1_i1.p1 TRINITY_DN90_c0_g1~~TRINITY_DN90_c0_g1_i1.p1  ORF type:complete len:402 (-),score=77.52 TRINITY_DN90_c0_g1_i1:868-2073(-)